MSDVLIDIQHISKKYCRSVKRAISYAVYDIGMELAGRSKHRETLRGGEFWALQNINFQVKKGEAIGLVGANGSGKTTLLRTIGGIIKPDRGQVVINGRIAPLLALGAGFSPILSGRENIFANMSILGMNTRQINEVYEQVIDFAEIGDSIDSPVKTYSSGMVARLGFACAIHTNPDVLLLDEIFAVGDGNFRAKCYRRLSQLRDQGTSFLLVSHSSPFIVSVCESAILIKKGEVVMQGRADEIIRAYDETTMPETQLIHDGRVNYAPQAGKAVNISEIAMFDEHSHVSNRLRSVQPFQVTFAAQNQSGETLDVDVVMTIRSQDGSEPHDILVLDSSVDGKQMQIKPGTQQISTYFPQCHLKRGMFSVKIALVHRGQEIAKADNFYFFVNADPVLVRSEFYQPRIWQMHE